MEDEDNFTDYGDRTEKYIVSQVVLNNSSFASQETASMYLELLKSVTNMSLLIREVDLTQLLSTPTCSRWDDLQHVYYQLANLVFLFTFTLPSRLGVAAFFFRTFLVIGCSLQLYYGLYMSCALDTVVWSTLFILVNTGWIITIIINQRPVHLEGKLLLAYTSLFQPLQLSRREFQVLVDACRCRKILAANEKYIEEKITRVDSLTLVLSGRLAVSQQTALLHYVSQNQFVDSPEWFGVSTDDYFQVSVSAVEDTELLVWHRDKLKFVLLKHPYLQTVFDHVLGRDVVKKLVQVQDNIDDNSIIAKKKGSSRNFLSSYIGTEKYKMKLGNITENENESLV